MSEDVDLVYGPRIPKLPGSKSHSSEWNCNRHFRPMTCEHGSWAGTSFVPSPVFAVLCETDRTITMFRRKGLYISAGQPVREVDIQLILRIAISPGELQEVVGKGQQTQMLRTRHRSPFMLLCWWRFFD